jgi:diacylglycerol kinase (ATP)
VPAAVSSIALIANPKSGGGNEPERVAAELRRLGTRVQLFEVDEAEGAAASGAERLVVAGGDGSIAPAAAAAAAAGLPLAVIPAGTANDFARGLDLPHELAAAIRLAAEGSSLRRLDLGRIGTRPFVNAASAGLAASATRAATGLKKLLGPLAYAAGALHAGLTERPLSCLVLADGELYFEGAAWQLTVAGTGHFGAGSRLETAEADDGLLDLAVMEARSRLRLVAHAYGLRAGRLTERSDVRHVQGRVIDLLVPVGTGFNVDGEVLTLGPVRMRIEPDAFELVVG